MLARPKAGPLITRKLINYRLGLYAAQSYVETTPMIRIADLRDHRLIGYVADLIYAPELRYLTELDARLEASICNSSIVAQAELIAAGAGCGILPCFIGDRTPGLNRLIADRIDIQRSFRLVVHRDVRTIARIGRFIDWLVSLTSGLQPLMLGYEAPP